jgi:hypothetical protein
MIATIQLTGLKATEDIFSKYFDGDLNLSKTCSSSKKSIALIFAILKSNKMSKEIFRETN